MTNKILHTKVSGVTFEGRQALIAQLSEDSASNIPLKQCTKCDELKLDTSDYFGSSHGKPHARLNCKRCSADYQLRRQRAKGVPPKQEIYRDGKKRCSNGDTCLHPDGDWLPATTEYFYSNGKKGLHGKCRVCDQAVYTSEKAKARVRERRLESPAKFRRYSEKWRNSPAGKAYMYIYHRTPKYKEKEKEREQTPSRKAWKAAYTPKYSQCFSMIIYRKNYRQSPSGRIKRKANDERRRALKRQLPAEFTANDWNNALTYFHDCCAVCERPPGLWHTLAMDHWIPLSSPECPGTIPTNIVPLCHGVDGCNNSKHNSDPHNWLIRKFGKSKSKKIEERIVTYLNWLKG